MENYIINKNTIAILKYENKTIIYDVENIRVINKNILSILNLNCNFYGSSLNGRKKSIKSILNIKYKIPILIDEDNNIILIQTNSLRKRNCLLLVVDKIIDYEEINNKLKITCANKHIFEIKLSINSFEKMLINSLKINNILKARKTLNFV